MKKILRSDHVVRKCCQEDLMSFDSIDRVEFRLIGFLAHKLQRRPHRQRALLAFQKPKQNFLCAIKFHCMFKLMKVNFFSLVFNVTKF